MAERETVTGMVEDKEIHPSVRDTLLAYVQVTKPISVGLLAFTTLGTMIVAAKVGPAGGELTWDLALLAMVTVVLAAAGTNAVTCYIDRDMDAVMERTKDRPIPSGKIDPPQRALAYGLTLLVISLVLGWLINPLSSLVLLLGFLDDAVVYNILTKRRSPLGVLAGGFSGGLPALFGWTAVTGSVTLVPILIAALVVLWIPNHIWNLAIAHTEDYEKVQVPMLPVVFSLRSTVRCIGATVFLMYVFSVALGIWGPFGWIYLGTALVSGLIVATGNLLMILHPSRERAWTMFKLSSPYLFILFLAMIIDVLVT